MREILLLVYLEQFLHDVVTVLVHYYLQRVRLDEFDYLALHLRVMGTALYRTLDDAATETVQT